MSSYRKRSGWTGPVRIPGAKVPGNDGFIGNREPIREFSGKWLVVVQMPLVCLTYFGHRAVKLRTIHMDIKIRIIFRFRLPLGADWLVILP